MEDYSFSSRYSYNTESGWLALWKRIFDAARKAREQEEEPVVVANDLEVTTESSSSVHTVEHDNDPLASKSSAGNSIYADDGVSHAELSWNSTACQQSCSQSFKATDHQVQTDDQLSTTLGAAFLTNKNELANLTAGVQTYNKDDDTNSNKCPQNISFVNLAETTTTPEQPTLAESYASKVKACINNCSKNNSPSNQAKQHQLTVPSICTFVAPLTMKPIFSSITPNQIGSTYSTTASTTPASSPSPEPQSSPIASKTPNQKWNSLKQFQTDFFRRSHVALLIKVYPPMSSFDTDYYLMNRLYALIATTTFYFFDQLAEDAMKVATVFVLNDLSSFDLKSESPLHYALFRMFFAKLPGNAQQAFKYRFQGKHESQVMVAQNLPTLLAFVRHTALKLTEAARGANTKEAAEARETANGVPFWKRRFCRYCRFITNHNVDACPILQATLCHRCLDFGHSLKYCTQSSPLLPEDWLKVGEQIYHRAAMKKKK